MASTIKGEGVKRGDLFRVPLDQVIVVHEDNTRFAPPPKDKLIEMRDSLRQYGQMEPAEVLLLPDKRVRLVDGHQRFTQLQELEKEDGQKRYLDCVLFKGNAEEAFFRSIKHNIDRNDLSPMDYAKNIRDMKSKYGKNDQEVASFFGRSTAWVSQMEKLLSLPVKRQKELHEQALSANLGFLLASGKIRPVDANETLEEAQDRTLQEAQRIADAEAGIEADPEPEQELPPISSIVVQAGDEATANALKEKGVNLATAPAPAKKTATKKATKKAATKKAAKVTETHVLQAGAKLGTLDPDAAPEMKMKEFKNYLQETFDTEPTGSGTREIARGLLKFLKRELSVKQMDNLFQKYLIEAPKAGKK